MNFEIFLSHHETEIELAQSLHGFLETISAGQIKVSTFVQKSEYGGPVGTWINEAAMSSNMFMFLYTDDTRELSWVAHEFGMYLASRKHQGKEPCVVCLRSRGITTMPPAMSYFEPILAQDKEIKKFLHNLLLAGAYSDGKRLAHVGPTDDGIQDQLDSQAKALSKLFRSKIHTHYFANRLIIKNIFRISLSKFKGEPKKDLHVVRHLINPDTHKEESYVLDFTKTRIEANDYVRGALGISDDCTWYDLLTLSDEMGPADRFDIPRDILSHASTRGPNDASSNILSEVEFHGKIFKPIISRVETRDRLPITYYLLLVPDDKSCDEEIGQHDGLNQYFHHDIKLVLMLSLARRFRWNVVEPSIWKIRRAVREEKGLGVILDELLSEMNEMEKEGASNKLDDGSLAALSFPDEHRQKLHDMWLNYYTIKNKIKERISRRDAKGVLESLNEIQVMNRNFLNIGLEAYRQNITALPTLDEAVPLWKETLFGND